MRKAEGIVAGRIEREARARFAKEGIGALALLLSPFALGQALAWAGALGSGWEERWGAAGLWLAGQGTWSCLLSGLALAAMALAPPEEPKEGCPCCGAGDWESRGASAGARALAGFGLLWALAGPLLPALGRLGSYPGRSWAEGAALGLSALGVLAWAGVALACLGALWCRWGRECAKGAALGEELEDSECARLEAAALREELPKARRSGRARSL